jgi:hypothetical protein
LRRYRDVRCRAAVEGQADVGSKHLNYELPNLEIILGEPALIAANGLLDPQTGLTTALTFDRDLATAVRQSLCDGGGLSVARFAFDPQDPRARLDGARIISKLMRKMDFGAVQRDGSILVVFADTDLRAAHGVARRLSAVMRHTTQGRRGARTEPVVTVATLQPNDSVKSLLARLYREAQRAPL